MGDRLPSGSPNQPVVQLAVAEGKAHGANARIGGHTGGEARMGLAEEEGLYCRSATRTRTQQSSTQPALKKVGIEEEEEMNKKLDE